MHCVLHQIFWGVLIFAARGCAAPARETPTTKPTLTGEDATITWLFDRRRDADAPAGSYGIRVLLADRSFEGTVSDDTVSLKLSESLSVSAQVPPLLQQPRDRGYGAVGQVIVQLQIGTALTNIIETIVDAADTRDSRTIEDARALTRLLLARDQLPVAVFASGWGRFYGVYSLTAVGRERLRNTYPRME